MANITDRITKEQFNAAYNKHLPSGWIKFAFKYFSKEVEKKNMAVKNGVAYFFGGLFLLGFLATILNFSNTIIKVFGLSYAILLTTLALYLFSAVFANNWRIKQIRKELGVTRDEYDALVSAYY
jgi:hypothetical protein